MKTMTIHDLAELCEVNPTTIGRWAQEASCKMPEISCKMQKARETSTPAAFTLDEALAIVRAGGKNVLADLLAENAASSAKALPPPRPHIPNGKQLEYLYKFRHDGTLSPYQVQLVLGVAVPRAPALPEVPATEEEAKTAFAKIFNQIGGSPGLPPGTVQRVVGAAAGAARRTLERIDADEKQKAIQPELGVTP